MRASVREILQPDTGLAFQAMRTLRTALTDEESFVRRVDDVQRREGYRLVGAFEDEGQPAAAVAGFRLAHNLAWGRHIYIDDLATHPAARRRGYGRALLEWVLEEARRLRCDQVHLDSGTVPERYDAHRLYLNTGFVIAAHHFHVALE